MLSLSAIVRIRIERRTDVELGSAQKFGRRLYGRLGVRASEVGAIVTSDGTTESPIEVGIQGLEGSRERPLFGDPIGPLAVFLRAVFWTQRNKNGAIPP